MSQYNRCNRELWEQMLAQSHPPEDWFQGAGDDRDDNPDNNQEECVDDDQTARMSNRNHLPSNQRTGRFGYVRPGIRSIRTSRGAWAS